MFSKLDLDQKIKKDEYKKTVDDLEIKLGLLQRRLKELGIPVIIAFEGWDAAGKGTIINRLLLSIDPRLYKVNSIKEPVEEEYLRPYLWRFWTKIPPNGIMGIFDRSWYWQIISDKIDKLIKKERWTYYFEEINNFERQLFDGGYVLIKLFLHISKKEQKKRFKKLLGNPATQWRVTEKDWKNHKHYNKFYNAFNELLRNTDTEHAPWTLIEAHDHRVAILKVFRTVISTIRKRIHAVENLTVNLPGDDFQKSRLESIPDKLSEVDLSLDISRKEYDSLLNDYQKQIRDIEYCIYSKRLPVIIVYQGWDAAGKGGNIKRLVQRMDPRGYEVIPVAAPNDEERAHHYLWRFWKYVPKAGHIAVFDRSWYGRILVERVEELCPEADWFLAYREINEFEKTLYCSGCVLIKFFLHISQDEQLRRFREREKIPYKQWKITPEDWRNREKWDEYYKAVNEMICRTGTDYAPWTIIESNCKLHARIKALQYTIETINNHLK